MNQLLNRIFYVGLISLSLFEIINVYFIMPMPGSQEIRSINIAYFLYNYRWLFRVFFTLMIALGSISVFQSSKKWLHSGALIVGIIIIYFLNFRMTADKMFKQPEKLSFRNKEENKVRDSSLVICIINNGAVKGYPIQFMAYHHQVQDNVGGKPVIITYCSVCRTGRVYEPIVNGHHEVFRLVGMDHFNAMFEDATTKSWWRQSTGEAIAGPLKGKLLQEAESMQLSVKKLFELYPAAMIMQSDEASTNHYDTLRKFEKGLSKSNLTRTDSLSWEKKSWIIGIQIESSSKVYDWTKLKEQHIINDKIGETPVILALSADGESFAAFLRPVLSENFKINNDTLFSNGVVYDFSGRCLNDPSKQLTRVKAYQEFWHSWKTFHPNSERYQ